MSWLDAYFHRIDHTGEAKPTATGLARLMLAHVRSIPFSNVEILRGQPVSLAADDVFDKLVTRRRGGYCFEQNGLFARVLTVLGFTVRPVGARVTLRAAPGEVTAVSHMALIVQAEGVDWLVDVGFGALSPTAPLRLVADKVQETPHEPRRLVPVGHGFAHEVRLVTEWLELYRLTPDEMHPIDQEVANWWTSTHPSSRFRTVLMVARAEDDGARLTLTEERLTRRARNGTEAVTPIESRAQVLEILERDFALDYPPDTRLALPGVAWAEAPN